MNRYDGMDKWRTKNCDGCPYLRVVNKEERCYWSVAWKTLTPQKKPQKCMLIDKPSPRKGGICEIDYKELKDSGRNSRLFL